MSLAFVFPGQGSQSVGMLSDMIASFPEMKATFQEASDSIGIDLLQLSEYGPEVELNQTSNTQPALLAASVALFRLFEQHFSVSPEYFAGHSLGEYTALVCASGLTLSAATKLVHDRGRFMQEAVPEGVGAMAAVLGLEREPIQEICERISRPSHIVSAANLNAPLQTVIAGHKAAVDAAATQLKEAGAKRVVMLPVSVPSHCALMEPAAVRLEQRLLELNVGQPLRKVLHNYDVEMHSSPTDIRHVLVKQLTSPVRFVETIQKLVSLGVTHIVECGPQQVLSGLIKKIAPEIIVLQMDTKEHFDATLKALS